MIEKGPQSVSFTERFSIVSFTRSVHYQRFYCSVHIYLLSAPRVPSDAANSCLLAFILVKSLGCTFQCVCVCVCVWGGGGGGGEEKQERGLKEREKEGEIEGKGKKREGEEEEEKEGEGKRGERERG